MNFRTIKDLNNTIIKNIHKIPDDIDLIVGVPRSGVFVASIIALYLNIPFTDTNSLLENRIMSCGKSKEKNTWVANIESARKILIVEDSINTGESLFEIKKKLMKSTFYDKLIFLSIYVNKKSQNIPDIYFDVCNMPRMFEWNYMHHKGLKNACVDIDGVLCVDPTEEQNDDGEKYVQFIRNAKARIIPTFKIGCLITSRLEKYRKDTEYWLEKNNIKYDKLIMMQYSTKEERIKKGNYGVYKAKQYKKIRNANIFIESNAKQAIQISKISKKAVFCIENQTFYGENFIHKVSKSIKSKIPSKIKKILKFIRRNSV